MPAIPENNLTSMMTKEDEVDVEINLRDLQDVQIYAQIFIGEQKEAFDVIFDTGSYFLWVDGSTCENCPSKNKKFDVRKSSTFVKNEYSDKSLYYGSGNVHGYTGRDTICLEKDSCSEGFKFMVVERQKGLDMIAASGLVGLSPTQWDSDGDLFLTKMVQTGTIDKAIFSMSIGMGTVQSKMTFGGYDTSTFATGELNWHKIHDPYFGKPIHWAIPMEGVSFKSPNGRARTWG